MALDKQSLDQLKLDRPVTAGPSRAPWVIAAVVIVVLAAAFFWWRHRAPAAVVETAVARGVATNGGSTTLLNASGYVTARREATVSSKITGRVVDVLVEEGMEVTEGQVLAHLDSANVATNLDLAEAQLAATRAALGETEANLALAVRTLERTKKLSAANVVSAADLDSADAAVDALRARLDRQRTEIAVAESQVAQWKQQLEDTVIRAPFAGVVVSKNAQPGEMISPMSSGGFTRTGICTVVDMSSLEIEVDVNESYINRVSPGQPVIATLDAYPDWKIPARVIAIIPTADRQKATVRVRVGFDELDPRILPDMGLKVAFQSTEESTGSQRVVVVPKAAVRRADGRDVVWVVRDGRLERRAVSVARTGDQEVALAAGIQENEHVVISNQQELVEGAPAREQQP